MELSEASKCHKELWRSLDATLVREKVLERAPWFSLDESIGLDTWHKCALVTINRTEQAGIESNQMLYVIKNLKVAVTLCCNKVEMVEPVDVSKNQTLRESMVPMFDGYSDPHMEVLDDGTSKGTKLLAFKSELDFKTLKVKPNKVVPDPHFQSSDFTDEAVAPSGLKVRNESKGAWIRVMDENEQLIHVRMRGLELSATDVLVHKATHEKDADGAFIVTNFAHPYYPGQHGMSDDTYAKVSLVSLLSSSGGALVVTSPDKDPRNQYLAYVEPLPGLPCVLLCSVPSGKGFKNDYDDVACRFSVCYDGYLYVYFEGRFLRLWVDLGRRASFDRKDLRENPLLHEELRGQALVVWERDFPAIGTLDNHVDMASIPTWISSSADGRFVTVGAAQGQLVGDLLTGTTYCSGVDGLSIPFFDEKNNKPGFYTADLGLVKRVVHEWSKNIGTKTEVDVSSCWEISATIGGDDGASDPIIVEDTPHKFRDVERIAAYEACGPDEFEDEWDSDEDDDEEDDDEEDDEEHSGTYQNRPALALNNSTLIRFARYNEIEDHSLPWMAYLR